MALPTLKMQGKSLSNTSAFFILFNALVLSSGLIITIMTLITTLATEVPHLELANGSLKPIMAQIVSQVAMETVHTLLALVDTVRTFSVLALFPFFLESSPRLFLKV